MKISTKTGDNGETGLYLGRRVKKSSALIGLLGELDELQAVIGWCKVEVKSGETKEILTRIIDDLYRIMSIVGYEFQAPKNIADIGGGDVVVLEEFIKKNENIFQDLGEFLRPGEGSEANARLHVARCVCRRVERVLVEVLEGYEGVNSELGKYLNRLSDLLFVAALKEG